MPLKAEPSESSRTASTLVPSLEGAVTGAAGIPATVLGVLESVGQTGSDIERRLEAIFWCRDTERSRTVKIDQLSRSYFFWVIT
jgi:hypothetical protein